MSRFIPSHVVNPYPRDTVQWRAYQALAGNMIGKIMCNAAVKGGWIKRPKRRRFSKPNNRTPRARDR